MAKEIERKLGDVEFYSPTMPLRWQEYHDIIRELLAVMKQPPAGHGDGI